MSVPRPLLCTWRYLLLTTFVIWWGGFTFYALAVVPSGHSVLKSRMRQGFITEQVTRKLNILGVLTLSFIAAELCRKQRKKETFRIATAWASWTGMAVTLVMLIWLHEKLGALLDFDRRTVLDDAQFYQMHRIYLLVASVQWLSGAVFLPVMWNSRSAGILLPRETGATKNR